MDPTVLNQRYRLDELVGAGGMATVYRGHDVLLDRAVAVKVLREPYASNSDFRQRFLEEARAAARLDHPNIVRIYDVGQVEHQPYIVMELVQGQDLKTIIRQNRPLPLAQALDLAQQICAGVGLAHRAGLVHCDLKPENILVTAQGEVKVADFGIARAFHDGPQPVAREQVVWGSPHYISPEQGAGAPPVPASDVYSIAVIMYEMLTGVPPFHAEDPTELVLKHMQEPPPPPSSLNPRIPPRLEWLLLKVLAKEPAARYRNAEQLGFAITSYLEQKDEPTIAQPAVRPLAAATSTPPPASTRSQAEALAQPPPASEESEESDTELWILIALTTVAVLGLIPLWFFVIRAWSQPVQPLPGLTPDEITPTVSETAAIVTVPRLIGLSAPEAQRLAEGLGLEINVLGEREDQDAVPGAVLEQEPPPGTRVPVETAVQVVLATSQVLPLPNVVGYALDDVRLGLESQGLLIHEETIWSTAPPNQILEQAPPAGTEVRAGSTITLTLSGGVQQPRALLVNLNQQIVLESASLSQTRFRPGDNLSLTLRWRCLANLDRSYKVFIHLLRSDGSLLTQRDIEPLNGFRPTNTWQVGDLVVDPHQVAIPSSTPAGTYVIRVGLYDERGRMPVVDPGNTEVIDNTIFIAEIEIAP